MNVYSKSIVIFCCILVSCTSRDHVSESSLKGIGSNTKSLATSKKQLNWMSHWYKRAGKEELVRQIAREFEFQHQELAVNLKFIQEVYNTTTDDRRQFNNEVVNMINTGKVTWDILVLDNPSYDSIAIKLNDMNWGAKYLVNFEEFEWFKNQHKSFLFEGSQYRRNTGGIIPGPIIEGIYLALWYNSNVTKKLGLDIKKTDITFDDLKAYFKAAYEYNQSHQDKVVLLYDDNQSHPVKILFNSLVISELGQFDPLHLDRAKSLLAFKRGLMALEELSKFQPLNKSFLNNTTDDPMLEQKALFFIKETWVYNRWAKASKSKASLIFPTELPVFEKPGMFYQGTYQSVYAVLKQSPNKDEAIELMKYWCSNDIAERWTNLTKNPTGLKTRISSVDFGVDDFAKFNNEISLKYGKNVQTIYLSEILFGQKNSSIDLNPLDVIEGRVTANEYYNSILRKIK